jgi:hypothetical protein
VERKRLIEFLWEVFAGYASSITGALTAPLAIISFFLFGVPRWATTTVLMVCVFITAYQVWKRERIRCETLAAEVKRLEGELNASADFRGTIVLEVEERLVLVEAVLQSMLHYQCHCVNYGQKAIVVNGLRFDIRHPAHSGIPPFYLTLRPDIVRSFGHGEVVTYMGQCLIEEIPPQHLREAHIAAALRDSLDAFYSDNIITKWRDGRPMAMP